MNQERLHAAASAIAHKDVLGMRGYADVYAQAGVQLPASIRTTVERAPPV